MTRLLGACPGIPTVHRRGRPPVSVEKQLLLTLWVLGNPECLRSVSDHFNVTKSSVYYIVRRVCSALVASCAKTFIRWPQGERAAEIMQKFEQNNGLPRCLGIVDGTHIPIKAPRVHPEQYVNRKNSTPFSCKLFATVTDFLWMCTVHSQGQCTTHVFCEILRCTKPEKTTKETCFLGIHTSLVIGPTCTHQNLGL